MKIESFWSWDARLIGIGETPERDSHLTIIEGEGAIQRATLAFPMLDAIRSKDPDNPFWRQLADRSNPRGLKWDELPLLAASRITCDIKITP